MTKNPKILFLDIETSYSVMASWSLWPNFIPHDNIIKEWHIICAAWKWKGKNRVHLKKTYNTDDKAVVAALRDAIISADEIVYHNGDKFDFKKLNTRALVHSLGPIPKPRATDTLKQCRKHFSFTCNRLDYIAKFLDLGGKIHTNNQLWLDCLEHKKKAIDEMGIYNKKDVTLLEEVYDKLTPYMDVAVNRNLINGTNIHCPSCHSSKVQRRGINRTKTGEYQRIHCQDCGAWSQMAERLNKGTKVNR